MIIGNGQLAQVFRDLDMENVVIFASGVPDSTCIDIDAFNREETLLLQTLVKYKKSKLVYFSSCALSSKEYQKNMYYNHKLNMEKIIKAHTTNYYIIRLPQLFGNLKKHRTLINFFHDSIINDKLFTIYNDAYRYVVEINDVRVLVENYLRISKSGIVVNIANNYRYSAQEIVETLELLLQKKARYKIENKEDKYYLNLHPLNEFIAKNHIDVKFCSEYLFEKLQVYIDNYKT